jgi:hypothetical protein
LIRFGQTVACRGSAPKKMAAAEAAMPPSHYGCASALG